MLIKIFQKPDNTAFSVTIDIDLRKKRKSPSQMKREEIRRKTWIQKKEVSLNVSHQSKRKSPSQRKREELRRLKWIQKKEDEKRLATVDESESYENCESSPIASGDADTLVIDCNTTTKHTTNATSIDETDEV